MTTETKSAILDQAAVERIMRKVPVAEKAGIISDGSSLNLALFKKPASTKPIALIPLEHVLMLLDDYFDNIDQYKR